jgi:hypothetical protein
MKAWRRRAAETERFRHGDGITETAKFHGLELIAFVYHGHSNKILSCAPLQGQTRRRKQDQKPMN